MDILPLEYKDIEDLSHLQPKGWSDIRKVFYQHCDKSYFEAWKGIHDENIVAIGEIIYCHGSAWLGNIIVSEEKRNRGLGRAMTAHLLESARERGIHRIYLLSTDFGRTVYQSLGFLESAIFSFFSLLPGKVELTGEYSVRTIMKGEYDWICTLDEKATGEDRSGILQHFLEKGKVAEDRSGRACGFYLPDLGDGLVIAETRKAGIELFKQRFNDNRNYVVVPERNHEFLAGTGIKTVSLSRKAYLMHFGPMKHWKPGMIYSRVGGYLG